MDVVIYGVINAANFVLIAIGFTLVYGVTRVANFAHGSLYILTGFVVWTLMQKVGLNYFFTIIISVGITAVVGMLVYQLFLIRVRGMPASEIIASFAIGMGIVELLKTIGFVGSYGNPVFIHGSIQLAGVPIDYQRFIIVILALCSVLFLLFFTRYTKTGLALRGIAQDEQAAMMVGINSDWSATVSLAIGSALASVAAVVILPLGNIYPGIGYEALVYAVAVCIVGGLGSLTGTIIAGVVLAFAQMITVKFLGGEWRMLVIFLGILLILIFKPSGLFGRQKELEERV